MFVTALAAAIPMRVAEHSTTLVPQAGASSNASASAHAINVRDYGAKGDGIADDTKALLSALFAAERGLAGEVLVPAGTYLTTRTLTLPHAIALVGQGHRSVIRSRTAGTALDIPFAECLVSDLIIEGTRDKRSPTAKGITLRQTTQSCLRNVCVREFTDAGIELTSCTRTLIQQCEVYHIANDSRTACGVRLADGYNNGIWIEGGEIHVCSVGVYLGAGATNVQIRTIIEGHQTSGLRYRSCNAVYISSYFEKNGMTGTGSDIEGVWLSDSSYDSPARHLTIDTSYFFNSPLAIYLRNTASVEIRNCSAPLFPMGTSATRVVCCIGNGTLNALSSSCQTLVFQNESGQIVRTESSALVPSNALAYSAAVEDRAWSYNNAIASVATVAPDGTKFLDGSTAMRIVVDSLCRKDRPAQVSQIIGELGGHLIGLRFWVRATKGSLGTVAPIIAGRRVVTGSASGMPHRQLITDEWQEISWTASMPKDNGPTTVGWYLFPNDQSTGNTFYIARPQAWIDSLEPPQYVATTNRREAFGVDPVSGVLPG